MSCDITKGRKLGCKDSRIGIKMVDFVPFEEFGFVTTLQEVATLPVSLTEVFRYEVKGTGNNLIETATVNLENRTTEIRAVISAVLPKLGKESDVELMAMMYGRVVAFVHDYNGNVFVVGIDSGLDSTGGTKSTDSSGYTITLEAMDNKYSPYLSASAKTALNALVSVAVIEP